MTRRPVIVAMGGGGFSSEPENPLLDDFVLSLAGVDGPRVCFLPTASGDAPTYVANFYDAFAAKASPTWLPLFTRRDADIGRVVAEQDVIYVGGGNTENLLAIWRVHGLDRVLREAWQRGTVLAGLSAGAICWFEAGVTDSFGAQLGPLRDGLGFLPGAFCPHYDTEILRRSRFRELVIAGEVPAGYAADDSAALVYEGDTLREAVSSRPNALAYRVEPLDGTVVERALPTRFLGSA